MAKNQAKVVFDTRTEINKKNKVQNLGKENREEGEVVSLIVFDMYFPTLIPWEQLKFGFF